VSRSVKKTILTVGFCAAALMSVVVSAFAQSAAPPAAAQPPAGALKVFLTCAVCDAAALKTALRFVEFVADESSADVGIVVTTSPSGVDELWTIKLAGRGRFADQSRTVTYVEKQGTAADAVRADLARFLKLGVAEYAASTPAGKDLDVAFRRAAAADASPIKKDQKDPWNYWVFRTSASMDSSGEQFQSYGSYYVSGSANRTTENWKMRFGGSKSLNRSSFTIDESLTIKTRLTDWSVDALVVKSLGPKWSFGLTSNIVGSTYSNSKLVSRVTPGIEYDIFPYRESSRRSLTMQYTVGGAHYDYEEETIFSKFHEMVAQHAATVSLGLRQPWGQAGGSFVFTQQLSSPDRTRLSLNGSMSVRLIKSLTLNTSGSYARIRDQFTLVKGEASDDEVLLRLRQLATGYRYSFSVGFGYSFGALSNVTVNPRFGG
jgi:hypothetical protein